MITFFRLAEHQVDFVLSSSFLIYNVCNTRIICSTKGVLLRSTKLSKPETLFVSELFQPYK